MKDNSEEAVLGRLPWTITPWFPTAAWFCPVHHLYQIPVWASRFGSDAGPLSLTYSYLFPTFFPLNDFQGLNGFWETTPRLWPCSSDASHQIYPWLYFSDRVISPLIVSFSVKDTKHSATPIKDPLLLLPFNQAVISCGALQFLKSSTYSTVPFPSHRWLSSVPALFTH